MLQGFRRGNRKPGDWKNIVNIYDSTGQNIIANPAMYLERIFHIEVRGLVGAKRVVLSMGVLHIKQFMCIDVCLNERAWLRFRPMKAAMPSRTDSSYEIHLEIPADLLSEGDNQLQVHLDEIPGLRNLSFAQRPKIRKLRIEAIEDAPQ